MSDALMIHESPSIDAESNQSSSRSLPKNLIQAQLQRQEYPSLLFLIRRRRRMTSLPMSMQILMRDANHENEKESRRTRMPQRNEPPQRYQRPESPGEQYRLGFQSPVSLMPTRRPQTRSKRRMMWMTTKSVNQSWMTLMLLILLQAFGERSRILQPAQAFTFVRPHQVAHWRRTERRRRRSTCQEHFHDHHHYRHSPTRPALFLSMDSLSNTPDDTTPTRPTDQQHFPAIVCGGGPAGLLTAIMLAEKLLPNQQQPQPNTKIHVYDRLPAPPPNPDDDAQWTGSDDVLTKYYLIGLGGRGQAALREYHLWDAVAQRSVPVVGRRNWEPDAPPQGTQRIFTQSDKKTTAQCLPRDKLVSLLHQTIVQTYGEQIELHYGKELRPVDFEYGQQGEQVLLQVYDTTNSDNLTIQNLSPSQVKVATEEPVETLVDGTVSASSSSQQSATTTAPTTLVTTDLLVAADGTVRTIANAMEQADLQNDDIVDKFRVVRYPDDNQRVYKTIPMEFPKMQQDEPTNESKNENTITDWRWDVNYSARTAGSEITFDALPANNRGQYCGVLLLKKNHPLAKANTDPRALRQLLQDALPQFNPLWSDETVATVAQKPVSYLPGFRYVAPRVHQGRRTILLGDCAHTVKPYFGLGANSALEDVQILGHVLEEYTNNGDDEKKSIDLTGAVLAYSERQSEQAAALVRLSRDLDRPGVLGAFTFVIPLILDSIFSGLLPDVFTPNVIAMLQRPEYTFTQVAERKRLDRAGQLALIGTVLTVVTTVINLAVAILGEWTGLQGLQLWAAAGLGGGLLVVVIQNIVLPLAVEPFLQKISNPRTDLTPLRYLSKDRSADEKDKGLGANGESWLVPKLLKFDNQQSTKEKR